jgi:peptidoglycan hydrolase-like protein with peptidoglycan-binding domain
VVKILFGKGAKGEIAKKAKRRLQGLGFDPQRIDGDYSAQELRVIIAHAVADKARANFPA